MPAPDGPSDPAPREQPQPARQNAPPTSTSATGTRTAVPDVVTIGEPMCLLLAEPGVTLERASTFRRSAAGAELNTAVALTRLGRHVSYLARVGDDPLGAAVLRVLRAEGLDTSRVRTDQHAPTGVLVRDCHPARDVTVAYYRVGSAGSRLSPDDIDPALIGGARLLHLTGITPALSDSARAATQAALRAATDAGCAVSFDPNRRRRLNQDVDELRRLAAYADLVLTGADEATWLTGCPDLREAVRWLLGRRPRLVVVKDAAQGSWATDGTSTWTQPARTVPVIDPVGAGDAFAAGFLHAWLDRAPVQQCLAEGADVAGCVVATAGDLEGLPDAEELSRARTNAPEVLR